MALKDTSNASLVLSAASSNLSCYAGATLHLSNYLVDASCQNGVKFATSGLPSGVTLSNDGTLAVASNAVTPASAMVSLAAINGWCNRATLPLQIQLLSQLPTGLAKAAFHYDASMLTGSNGQKVLSWSNLGIAGSGFHLLQTASNRQPLLNIGAGSIQGVQFISSSNSMLANAAALTGSNVTGYPFNFVYTGSNTSNLGITCLSVVTCADSNANNFFCVLNSGTGSNIINNERSCFYTQGLATQYASSIGHTPSNTFVGMKMSEARTIVPNNRQIFATRLQNGTGSTKQQWAMFLNSNVARPIAPFQGSSNSVIYNRDYHRIHLGAYFNTFFLNGTIHEVAVFNTALQDSELGDVMNTLRTKWNVA